MIRMSEKFARERFGQDFAVYLEKFSSVIGFSHNTEGGELRDELNPDRLDLASYYGLHRSIETFYAGRSQNNRIRWTGKKMLSAEKSGLDRRPYILFFQAYNGNRSLGDDLPYLIEFQERVHATVGKDRKKASIGLHDLDNTSPPFRYTALDPENLNFTTYDGFKGSADQILKSHPKGIEYSGLLGDTSMVPVILDSSGEVLSMPPIVNGSKSVISGKTHNIFVDITGTEFQAVRNAFYLMIYELMAMGYDITVPDQQIQKSLQSKLRSYDGRAVYIVPDEIKKLLGMHLSESDSALYLKRMGFEASVHGKHIVAMTPGNRIDVMGPSDIIEDIAKASGFDNVPEKALNIQTIGSQLELTGFRETVRDVMIGLGYQEIMTYVITSASVYRRFTYHGGMELVNPKSAENSVVRDRIFPNFIEFFKNNKRRQYPQRIFEIGSVIREMDQKTVLSVAVADSRVSVNVMRQVMEVLGRRFLNGEFTLNEEDSEGFIHGRCGGIYHDGIRIGELGEIHPEYLEDWDINMPLAVLELDLGLMFSRLNRN
ncbi:MAG: phenylalanine--tRNA ligase subunit beta [Thermoplasmata archaeon]